MHVIEKRLKINHISTHLYISIEKIILKMDSHTASKKPQHTSLAYIYLDASYFFMHPVESLVVMNFL